MRQEEYCEAEECKCRLNSWEELYHKLCFECIVLIEGLETSEE
jgi:hypothetical protein